MPTPYKQHIAPATRLKWWCEQNGLSYTTVAGRVHKNKPWEECINPERPQQHNTRLVTIDGETRTLREWSDEAGVTTSAFAQRIKNHPEEMWLLGKEEFGEIRVSKITATRMARHKAKYRNRRGVYEYIGSNGVNYIGSSISLGKRKSTWASVFAGTRECHNKAMGRDIAAGVTFEFTILEYCDDMVEEELREREQQLIDASKNILYNSQKYT